MACLCLPNYAAPLANQLVHAAVSAFELSLEMVTS